MDEVVMDGNIYYGDNQDKAAWSTNPEFGNTPEIDTVGTMI